MHLQVGQLESTGLGGKQHGEGGVFREFDGTNGIHHNAQTLPFGHPYFLHHASEVSIMLVRREYVRQRHTV